MKLSKQKRHRRILAELNTRQAIRISELADLFQVTPETARRDIEELSQEGLLVRTYGGATLSSIAHEPPARVRATANTEQRLLIARRTLQLIENASVLMIDGGSTTTIFATELGVKLSGHVKKALTVITNSVDIARTLSPSSAIRIILCPGDFDAYENAVFGARTTDFLAEFHADAAVVSAGGISGTGITDVNSLAASVKREMVRQSDRLILLIDESKFGINQMERICDLEVIDDIVVNKPLPASIQTAIEPLDVKVWQP